MAYEWLNGLSVPGDNRTITRAPWTGPIRGELRTVATNGHAMAIVPPQDWAAAGEPKFTASVEQVLALTDWTPLLTVDVGTLKAWLADTLPPPEAKCSACDGTGMEKCEACDGTGEFECSCTECGNEHTSDCEDCKGKGEWACGACQGHKRTKHYLRLGRGWFAADKVALVVPHLPDGSAVLYQKNEERQLVIVAGEVTALIMPVRMGSVDAPQEVRHEFSPAIAA